MRGTSFLADIIYEVRKFRCLWDHSCNTWRDIPKKKAAWKKVAENLHVGNGKYYFTF